MTQKSLTRSFGGGEVTPELYARVDLLQIQTGLRTCRNFIIRPHGPATNRAGLDYVLETKFSLKHSVLLPFIYNTTQTYELEFGDFYVRFHTQAGTVLEANQNITGISVANPGVFTVAAHGFTTGQWLFLSGIVTGPTILNGRFFIITVTGANTFTLTDLAGNAISTVGLAAWVAGGVVARVYEIVSPYAEADLFDLHITQSADVLSIVHPSYQTRELRRTGATAWAFTALVVLPTQAAPTAPVATPTLAGAIPYTYVVTALSAEGEESLHTADATCTNDLSIAGHSNKITFTNAASAVRYNVYSKENGIYGYIGQTSDGVTGFVDDNITPNLSITPPEANDPITAANDRPGAVGYFQGRRWFAGSNNSPQNLLATRSGTESNMTYSIPTRDDDSINVRLTSRQGNTIRHIVPVSDLILLTSGGEWKVDAGGGAVITPSTIAYTPEDYIGASNVAPVVTQSAILYAQDRGGRVREMKYSWQQQGYKTSDISIMAPHLFDDYTITSMTFARAPYSALWETRSDGTLVGLTYVQEHQIAAWHHHDTAGTFEHVCAVPEGTEDVPYMIIKRTINGRTVRYVERMHTRTITTLADCFFVDSGLTYDGAPATVISGLWHLEGATVAILGDGAVFPQAVVTNGTVTLSQACSKVQIGLPYVSDLETLPLSWEAMAAGQGTQKNVNKVYLRVNESSAVFAGPSLDRLTEAKQRTTEPYGTPPNLISGVIPVVITPSWNQDGGVSIRQANPLPVTLLSMTAEFAVGG